MGIDHRKEIQRITVEGRIYVLVAEQVYEQLLRRLDGLEASREIRQSRSDASFNFVDALIREKLTPEQVRNVLRAPTLGKRLAVLRESRRMDQTDLADKAGVSQAAISKLESGETKRPSLELIEKILKGLDLPDVLTYALLRNDIVPSARARELVSASR
jgi:DNA-binding XRE family transcriptional regulator